MAVALHPLGDRLLSEVDEVVGYLRAGGPAKLDARRAAARLDVTIVRRDLGDHLLGLTLSDDRVLLHERLTGAVLAFVLGHELAHVLRRRGRFAGLDGDEEEWFADWFAHELVLPRRSVGRSLTEQRLAALHVRYATLALQLAVVGEAPALMRDGPRVLCRRCGTAQRRSGCECLRWRQLSADRRALLPDVRGWLQRRWLANERRSGVQLEFPGAGFALRCDAALQPRLSSVG